MLKITKYLITLLIAVTVLTSCAPQQSIYDPQNIPHLQDYKARFLNNQKIGFTANSITTDDQGKIVTESADVVQFKLLGQPQDRLERSITIEDPNGTLIKYERMTQQENTVLFLFPSRNTEYKSATRNKNGNYELLMQVDDQAYKHITPIPDDCLMPGQFLNLQKQKGLKQGTTYSAKLFDIESLTSRIVKVEIGPEKIVELIEGDKELTEVKYTIVQNEGVFEYTSYVDKDLKDYKSVSSMGGMTVKEVACSRQYALSDNDEISLEVMLGLTCPEPIKNLYADKIQYLVKAKSGNTLTLPSTDYQQLDAPLADGSRWMTIYTLKAQKGESFPYTDNNKDALKALKPTDLINSDNDAIIKLSKKAVGNAKDSAQAIKNIESFVRDYVIPDMDVNTESVFPTSLEVARQRRGVCRHYAVLSAALCRAAGIPSKLVTGYVYIGDYQGVKNSFMGHAWCQAYVGGKWIPIDSTRGTFFGLLKTHSVGHIATHIAYGNKSELVDIASRLGTFEIVEMKQ